MKPPPIKAPSKVAGITLLPEGKQFTYTTADGLGKIVYRKLNAPTLNAVYMAANADPRKNEVDQTLFQIAALEKGVVSWQGFIDEQGKPVPVTREYLCALPPLIFNELFSLIMPEVGKSLNPLPDSKST